MFAISEIPQDAMAVDTVYNTTVPFSAADVRADGGEEEKMETDQKGREEGKGKADRGGGEKTDEPTMLPESLSIGEGNVRLNTAIRRAVKKRKKHQQKLGKNILKCVMLIKNVKFQANRAGKLADTLGESMEL